MGENPSSARLRIKAILWDNDGVLVDTEGLYFEATRRVLIGLGVDLTPEQYRRYYLHDNRGAWHLALARGFSRQDIEVARMRRDHRYSKLLEPGPPIISGVRETLELLYGRVRMGVATSSRLCHFDQIHRSSGLMKYLDFAITADDVQETKPSPELYLKALDAAHVRPSEAIVVEDSPRGLHSAITAGIACYVIPTKWTADGDYSAATAVLKDVRELANILDPAIVETPAH